MTKDKKILPLIKSPKNQESGEFKRPDHPDFMDAAELKVAKFSGYRQNSLSKDCEIWVEGEMKRSISPTELQFNHNAINEAMQEIFALDRVMPNTPVAVAAEIIRQKREDNIVTVIMDESKTKH
jgi:hypothetical protein